MIFPTCLIKLLTAHNRNLDKSVADSIGYSFFGNTGINLSESTNGVLLVVFWEIFAANGKDFVLL